MNVTWSLSFYTQAGRKGSLGRRLAPLLLLALVVGACRPTTNTVRVAGSTSVQPLAEVLAEAFQSAGGSRVAIQGGGSTAGVQAVLHGTVSIGMISRALTADEASQGLVAHAIGHDVLTVVVHPANPLSNIRREQLRALYVGELTQWDLLGWPGGAVHLVSREAGSGSREAFRALIGPISQHALIQNSSGAIRAAVMADRHAIGFISLGVAREGGVKRLMVDGRSPGYPGYPLMRPLSFVTRKQLTPEVVRFLRFVRGAQGQRLVADEGLVPLADDAAN